MGANRHFRGPSALRLGKEFPVPTEQGVVRPWTSLDVIARTAVTAAESQNPTIQPVAYS
jgi:hypothetical protein